jgi:hypothetical protein
LRLWEIGVCDCLHKASGGFGLCVCHGRVGIGVGVGESGMFRGGNIPARFLWLWLV